MLENTCGHIYVSISGYIYLYIMHDINEKYIHKIYFVLYMKFHIRGSFKKLIKKSLNGSCCHKRMS